MKNFKKIALGLIVGALAIGFSSFTNAKKSLVSHKGTTFTATYYSTSGTPGDATASHYVYIDDESDLCDVNTQKECTGSWQTTSAPVVNDPPTGSPVYEGEIHSGVYDPGL
jgi:hypothetical protein